jgi:hypothetical protein
VVRSGTYSIPLSVVPGPADASTCLASSDGAFALFLPSTGASLWASASATANIIDRLESSLFELRTETSDIVCVEGAIIRRSSMV